MTKAMQRLAEISHKHFNNDYYAFKQSETKDSKGTAINLDIFKISYPSGFIN